MSEVALSIFFISGCMGENEFHERIVSALARSDHEAIAARSCADELRRIAARLPGVADAALDVRSAATGIPWVPPSRIASDANPRSSQAWSEIARRERALEGDLNAIQAADAIGPAALARVVDAVEHARRVRATLCQARDDANEVVARSDARSLPKHAMSLK